MELSEVFNIRVFSSIIWCFCFAFLLFDNTNRGIVTIKLHIHLLYIQEFRNLYKDIYHALIFSYAREGLFK